MNILYYDNDIGVEEAQDIFRKLIDYGLKDTIGLPKNVLLLENVSIHHLKHVQNDIKNAIEKRENTFYSGPTQVRYWDYTKKDYSWGIACYDVVIRAEDGEAFDIDIIEALAPKKIIDSDNVFIEYDWRDLTKFQVNDGMKEI